MTTANTDSATSGSLSERARAELRPSQLIPALMSGVLNWALEVALAVSFADQLSALNGEEVAYKGLTADRDRLVQALLELGNTPQ